MLICIKHYAFQCTSFETPSEISSGFINQINMRIFTHKPHLIPIKKEKENQAPSIKTKNINQTGTTESTTFNLL